MNRRVRDSGRDDGYGRRTALAREWESGVETLLVVGAGPKALAVAAKSHVLRQLGLSAPRVIAVEAHAVGGNWLASGGWTDGRHRLGTSPEKDIGFPYHSTWARGHNREINEAMMAFSWTSFLVEHGTYAEWIDRGRPSPQHHVWAKYLQWVARKIDLELVLGKVRTIRQRPTDGGAGWSVEVAGADGATTELEADGLMITGPGQSTKALAKHPRVLSIAEFWDLAGKRKLPISSRAAVIGGGETAGSALDELVRHEMLTISVISPMATIYTRGESYFENSLFSDPTKWNALSIQERRDVIRRTDRGVFSVRVQESLLGDNRVHHLQGRVTRIVGQGDGVAVTLRNEMRADQVHNFDLVVDATGGQPLWFLDLFDSESADLLELAVGGPLTQQRIESSIGYDLAVTGLGAKLYLPNMAALAQGPGFPNLSCLGELSDRVLRAEPARVRAGARQLAAQ
ncbi:SidA/IucD/PvdA family monooxygenase [Nocardia farcinica]|uniref:L-lysine N6-monooxygenase MbtG n=1 Tax=Nocardia farcinica TaxID=37329 RepID=A0A0H5NTR2_NOCFR|nr:lysine 6-monooxygenase [Nocardia farcinica]MBF6072195.1 SidA/IucD/PvdA family monooxygenase [Nocardia farcinica]MBF6138643.1 SidA/IucD/PvdA family monooxygenase [Nocardia farcinica]MBF6251640.1 SidA/IucD/PvdA family monooxygenase [Nocardia farcinica]MBF6256376.1 SidA/IucD/PvdA family monooxygenase [Nocardia farcinica]